jgi:hypothetical protein
MARKRCKPEEIVSPISRWSTANDEITCTISLVVQFFNIFDGYIVE